MVWLTKLLPPSPNTFLCLWSFYWCVYFRLLDETFRQGGVHAGRLPGTVRYGTVRLLRHMAPCRRPLRALLVLVLGWWLLFAPTVPALVAVVVVVVLVLVLVLAAAVLPIR